jgi:hypothetical protein
MGKQSGGCRRTERDDALGVLCLELLQDRPTTFERQLSTNRQLRRR